MTPYKTVKLRRAEYRVYPNGTVMQRKLVRDEVRWHKLPVGYVHKIARVRELAEKD